MAEHPVAPRLRAANVSRRALLGGLATAPLAVSAVTGARSGALTPPFASRGEKPAALQRTPEGRSLSRFRYHNAEGFFRSVEGRLLRHPADQLYQIGIVQQLGLSSYLLDVGFTDAWCARNIGLNVAKSLAFANATGFDFECQDMKLLAAILSPYSKWRHADARHIASDCPFTARRMQTMTRNLLDRVHEVTGHPRPRGWHRFA